VAKGYEEEHHLVVLDGSRQSQHGYADEDDAAGQDPAHNRQVGHDGGGTRVHAHSNQQESNHLGVATHTVHTHSRRRRETEKEGKKEANEKGLKDSRLESSNNKSVYTQAHTYAEYCTCHRKINTYLWPAIISQFN